MKGTNLFSFTGQNVGNGNNNKFTSMVSTATTFSPASANVTLTSYSQRRGQFLYIVSKYVLTGAGGAGAVTLDISTVAGSPLIDTAVLQGGASASNQNASLLGHGSLFIAGTSWSSLVVLYATTTTMKFVATGGGGFVDLSSYGNGSSLDCIVELPIVGWS